MKAHVTALQGVLLLEPQLHSDERGFFYESFNAAGFAAATGLAVDFVQDNHTRSARGVLRGLHYQLRPPQGKLVRVVRGAVFDVVVDVRRASPTLGRHLAVELSEADARQLWIPAGFAHGFLALTDGAEVTYKVTDYYDPGSEQAIAWDDPQLRIPWPLEQVGTCVRLSPRDAGASSFSGAKLIE
jgi:dTDP-4-dehydrorhamnose 3,5-epimerase